MDHYLTYEIHAAQLVRERLAEAERGRLVQLARRAGPQRRRMSLGWPRFCLWVAGELLLHTGRWLIEVSARPHAHPAHGHRMLHAHP